jgi:hypothetical protein
MASKKRSGIVRMVYRPFFFRNLEALETTLKDPVCREKSVRIKPRIPVPTFPVISLQMM